MNNDSIEKKISDAIKKIDDIKVKEPELNWFVDLVSDEQLRIAKRQNKQLSIFCALGVIIIALSFSLYAFFFSAFVVVQAMSLIFPIVIFVVARLVSKEARIQ